MKKSNYQRPHTKVLIIDAKELLQIAIDSKSDPISGEEGESKFFDLEDNDDNYSGSNWED